MTKNRIYLLLIALFFCACSNTKYLPVGQKLYTGARLKVVNKDVKKADSKALVADLSTLPRPAPNSSILGLRVKLYLWNITQTKKKRGLKAWLHKKGEPPVLVSAVDLTKNTEIMTNRSQNLGYFQAQISGDTVSKGRTAKAVYSINTGPDYKIRRIEFPATKDNIDTAVAGSAKQTLLKVGDSYNLDVIKNERIRIDARLKEEGYYYFAPEDIIMRVDSNVGAHQVDIFVKVKASTADKAKRIYTINNIYVYPNYSLRDTSLKLDSAVKSRWYYVVGNQNPVTVHNWLFKNTVLLHPGDVYNRDDHTKSLNRFVELGPFKFVKNRFEDVSTDSPKLNVFYQLSQYPKKALQLDLLGRTTSANYNGTQVNLSWKNRNAFKGGELLTVTFFASSDGQISGAYGGYPLNTFGTNVSLSWPRFISPFNIKSDNAYIPRTNLTVGYSIVNRVSLYNLNSYNGSFGYQWKANSFVSHQLDLLDITYVNPQSITPLYRHQIDSIRDPALVHVIQPEFTWGPSYSWTYDNTSMTNRVNTMYYKGRLSLSNNLLGIVEGADTLKGKVKTLFGTPYSQYFKFENEYRFFHKVGPKSVLATRVMADFGMPYGNSTILPFSQQFFIGGPNDLRGFQARSVGPGTTDPYHFVGSNGFLPDESGDIRLEGTIEYRPYLFSIVRGAIFMDAGNVWDLKPQPELPGAAIGKNFLSQLAVDAGFGLRFDVTILVLRTDFGFPLVKPWLGSGFNAPKLKDGVFNLAIGYPF